MPWWKILWKYSLFEAGDSGWSLIVVSTYFGAFLQAVLKEPTADFGWAVTTGALIIALISPVLGAAADHSGRRQPYLRLFVSGVVLCTAALGWVTSAPAAIALFILAYVCVNGAFTFFAAMIPAVSNQKNVATIVSMTVGMGYAGSLFCILTLSRLVFSDQYAARVFFPMSVIYLVFAFPAMYLAPDFTAQGTHAFDVPAAYRRIRQTFREARRYRDLFRFLIGDFMYENAVASVVTVMGLYSRNIMGFESGELARLFGPAIVVAMFSAWGVFGPLIRAVGPRKAVLLDLAVWLILFALLFIVRPGATLSLAGFHLGTKTLFTVIVAPLTGLGLAGLWSSSRVLLTALTPAHRSGEFWGLYNLSGRTASVLGDATWSASLTLFGADLFGYQVAIGILALYVLAGAVLIRSVTDVRPGASNFLEARPGG